ncbi:peroxisome biogenesis protein 3-2-like isoform X2 [Magnolia sinica]|uniref:peroxisome biogenesis protein 3-2-like isoform X2 n=1 Tax=Magnolia sinica TaxID=86752 RepID=UPI002659132D|nr:peroxisome biogenesis protein 3-2-like isoform X2 [Magnolia sinica]
MLSLRDFWRRHKRKAYVAVGVFGSGYVLYKLYSTYRRRISDSESDYEGGQSEINEIIKRQLQTHFENIQRISDSMTLPYAIHYLRCRISEELDLSQLTERLMQGKGQPNTLSPKEKLELWERLKILSFTRTALSLWSMTLLTLYIRVQVNILGRHLYIDTARGLGSSGVLDEIDAFDRHSQQEFLATADYLSNYGMSSLIPNMQRAAMEVLKEKQLRDPFSTNQLRETIVQILDSFMSMGPPHQWVTYLVPENAIVYKQLVAASSDGSALLPDVSKLDQLMAETRVVLSSDDFRNVAKISLKKVVDGLMEEVEMQSKSGPSLGVPLAKLLPRVAQLGTRLLEEPSQNSFIQIIRSLPEVELFYTLLYANMPMIS